MTNFRKHRAYFSNLGRLLFREEYKALAAFYALPLDVNLAGNWFTIETRDDMVMHLRRHHVALLNRGATAIHPEVIAVELPLHQPRLWVRWAEENPKNNDERVSDVIYHQINKGSDPLISRINFTSLMMPEFAKASINKRLMPLIPG